MYQEPPLCQAWCVLYHLTVLITPEIGSPHRPRSYCISLDEETDTQLKLRKIELLSNCSLGIRIQILLHHCLLQSMGFQSLERGG